MIVDDASPNQQPAANSADFLPLVYEELRQLAAHKLYAEIPGQTLQATALVHEAYVRLIDSREASRWANRNHFFAAAAEAMRRILIERARQRESLKGGAGHTRIPLSQADFMIAESDVDLLALNEALEELECHDRRAAELVKLRFFAGFGHVEAAEIMQIERRVADRLWVLARTWLYRRLASS